MSADNAITFDGKDVYQGEVYVAVPNIHIWEQYNPRNKVAGVALHGLKGELLERKGNRCKVRAGDVEGYVKYWFIKELKEDWLKGRLEAGA